MTTATVVSTAIEREKDAVAASSTAIGEISATTTSLAATAATKKEHYRHQ